MKILEALKKAKAQEVIETIPVTIRVPVEINERWERVIDLLEEDDVKMSKNWIMNQLLLTFIEEAKKKTAWFKTIPNGGTNGTDAI